MPDTLEDVPLDCGQTPSFNQRVYAEARRIPPGRIVHYGDLAKSLGDPGASRAVGRALGRNPFAPIVPCYRVLAAGGRSGGFSATGGVATKLKMLELEGARFGDQDGLF
jgi:methylated-DNA-[protein]-cysteine S-methyltransferase